MNVPKLRFGEFKDEWQVNEIGSIAEVTTGNKDTQNREENGIYPFFVRSQTVERINSFVYDGEAVLTSGDGVGVGKNFHYINGKFDFHQRVYCIYKFKKEIYGKFVYSYFSEKFNKRVMQLSAKNSVDSVRRTMVTEMPINIPCYEEQQKIADFLSAVDEKITALTAQKTALTQYKQGMMQRIFAQTLRFKDDNGADYPEWEIGELKQFCQVNPKAENLPDEFIYIDLESVESGQLLKENLIFIEDAPSRAQRLLQVNDVLFQMVRPYQKNNLFFDRVGQYVASTGYAQIRTTENPKFLYYCLHVQEFVSEIMNRCTGTSYPAINSTDLETIEIAMPVIEEQTKIAQFLTECDDKINAVDAQIQSAQQWKQGLLQQMFV